MKKFCQILALSIGCLAVGLADAYSPAETPYLLGDWDGARAESAESGVELKLQHTFDVYDDFSGASDSGIAYFSRLRVAATFDLEKLLGWDSAAFGISGVDQYGKNYNRSRFGVLTTPGGTTDHNSLVNFSAGQTLFNLDRDGRRTIDASFSYNYAPEDRNTDHHQVTALARAIGPFATRPHDELGIGLITTFLSDDYSASSVAAGGASADNEYTVELADKAAVTPWFIIQPDLQVVIDPAGDNSRAPVWIAGLRSVIQF